MKKRIALPMAALAGILTIAAAAEGDVHAPQQQSYIMVYHKDADHGLHMAVSDDSFNWRAVNGDKPIVDTTDVALQKGIRDPFIARTPDGLYIVAMTDLHVFGKRDGVRDTEWERPFELYEWGNNRGLVILTSRDLVNWQKHYINFTEIPGFENVGCVWAPELTWDDTTNSFLMHYTTRFGNGRNEIYAAHLSVVEDANRTVVSLAEKPFPLFSAPRDANGKTRYNVIDSDIVRGDDGLWHLFYVSHEKGARIHQATSSRLTGPYTGLGRVEDGEERAHEAPNCWRRPDGTWVLMWDCFRRKPHNFGFVETSDFKEWKPIGYFDQKGSKMKRTGFAEQKHGSVIRVPAEIVHNLEEVGLH